MISFAQIEELMKIQNHSWPVISLYLESNDHQYSKHDCEVAVKDLIKGKEAAVALLQDKEHRASVEKDFERIRSYIRNEFDWKGKKGLALFASSGSGLWQIYSLPQPVRNTLIVNHSPYIRPLVALLDEYPRFCVVLVDKEKARIFEVFLGEINEHSEIIDELPRKTKAGGWKGYEENRIQRHANEEVHKHFKKVGDAVMDLSKIYRFDSLILAGHRTDFSAFENDLHPYLKEKVLARIEVDLHVSKETVLEKATEVERQTRKEKEEKLVKRLQDLSNERMAVMGLVPTLTAHQQGQIHSLVIGKDYQVAGAKCMACGFLAHRTHECPSCRQPLQDIPDLVDDLIESALSQGAKIEYVSGRDHVHPMGGIAAILRYKM
jgi:peptide subunit release factor 1 (eRF1)